MAYVLGFFAADGTMIENNRGAHFIEFHNTNRWLIEGVRNALRSNHKISKRFYKNNKWQPGYRLQIGSKAMFNDLLELGFAPNKSKELQLPCVPDAYLKDFVRGYFDGDGHVWVGWKNKKRKISTSTILVGFTCGCREFLENLKLVLIKKGLNGGSVVSKERGFCLQYSIKDSYRLYQFMYGREHGNLYLKRKKVIFDRYFRKKEFKVRP